MDFYNIYLRKCIEKNVSPSKAAVEAGTTKTAVSRWKAGSIPSDATMLKLADYFGCSVDDFRGEKEKPPATNEGDGEMDEMLQTLRERPDMRMLFNVTKKSTPEQVMNLATFLKGLEPHDDD